MTDNLPNAIYEGSVNIAGIEIKTYVLDDGRRIIDMEGANKLLDWLAGGNELTPEDATKLVLVKNDRTVMERKDLPTKG